MVTVWLNIGSLTVRHKHPPLPALSVELCSSGNGNHTFLHSTLNHSTNSYTSVLDIKDKWNQTTEVSSGSGSHAVSTVY